MRAANLVFWNIYEAFGAFCVEVVFGALSFAPMGEGGIKKYIFSHRCEAGLGLRPAGEHRPHLQRAGRVGDRVRRRLGLHRAGRAAPNTSKTQVLGPGHN